MELGPFMGVRSIKANVSIEASGIKVDEDALRVQKIQKAYTDRRISK